MVKALLALACIAAYPLTASAQLISLKTVPVAAGDQFLLFSSQTLAMGGVSIAIDDPLGDRFVNPAKGGRLRETRLFSSPSFYGISDDNGSALSLPVGIFGGGRRWFGGGAVALQQLRESDRFGGVFPLRTDIWPGPIESPLSRRSSTNLFGFGTVGHSFADSKISVGASVFAADLRAVDGVELLYAMSEGIDQSGYLADVRVGMLAEMTGDRTLEAVALHHRLSMTHDVSYIDWIVTDSTLWIVEPQRRLETNLDRTNTWGLHLGYVQPLAGPWRIGGMLTANVKDHPKIPNYEIQNIPRDPGTSWAYNLGVGLSRTGVSSTFALDIVYEPIRSHTWAEAGEQVTSEGGNVIRPGEKTVDNRFVFSNATMRLGASHDVGIATFQLGLQARSIHYELRQTDLVLETLRRQREEWVEWTPSWGVSLKLTDFEVRYLGRLLTGTGRPGIAWGGVARGNLEAAAAADIILAPSGPLTLQDARVLTHQISISMPLR